MTSAVTRLLRRLLAVAVFVLAAGPAALAGESAEVLFPQAGIRWAKVSPTGSWIAATAQHGDIKGVLVQRIGVADVVTVLGTEDWVGELEWVGPDAVFCRVHADGGWRTLLVRLEFHDNKTTFKIERLRIPGALVDPLPLRAGEVLWHFRERGKGSIHLVTIEEILSYGDEDKRRTRLKEVGDQLAVFNGSVGNWVVDHRGYPRGAIRRNDEDEVSIWARGASDTKFRKIYSYVDDADDEGEVDLLGMTRDGLKFVVRAYHDGDRLGLFEMDSQTGKIGAPLFLHDDVDVTGVLIDYISHDLIAAVYEVGGDRKFHYFDSYRNKFLDSWKGEHSKESIQVMSGTLDRRFYTVRVAGPQNPGTFYVRDSILGSTTLIAESGSDIDRETLSEVRSFKVQSEDGTEIEAFLTLPRSHGSGPHPLVVYPHGGPFEVRDNRDYSPLVQYLASWGYAVLQPNYRGSAGYGKKFVESGKKEWAKGIEDDIDAAVGYAMGLGEIDERRICIVGGSYGGFSAIASVVRHKQRYRCSISINGVSDVPLLYNSSDMADWESVMEFYHEYVGDLETEREKLVEVSPVYHVKEIETPIFLIYGTEDRRVDPDHSHRMLLMLETYGKEHDALEVRDMAHSPDRREWVIVARAIRRYLTGYLNPDVAFVADPRRDSSGTKATSKLRFRLR